MLNYYGDIIFLIIVIIIIIYIINFTLVKHKKSKAMLYGPIITLFLIVIVFITINFIEYNNYEPDIHQVVFEGELELSIIKSEDGNYLINESTNEEVTYINVYDKKPFKSTNIQPIYLKDIGDYYLVVFSPDKNKVILNERFLQGDYERHDVDHLLLIEKETGYIFKTASHDLIGLEIDLTSFQFGNNLIVFGLFLPYENNISFYQYINIKEDYSIEDAKSLYENHYSDFVGDWTNPAIHFHVLGDPSEIVSFGISGNYIYYQDSYNRLFVGSFKDDNYGVRFSFYETLMDEELAKEGNIKVTDTGIYYLSNDSHLYKVTSYLVPKFIELNVSPEKFHSYDFE